MYIRVFLQRTWIALHLFVTRYGIVTHFVVLFFSILFFIYHSFTKLLLFFAGENSLVSRYTTCAIHNSQFSTGHVISQKLRRFAVDIANLISLCTMLAAVWKSQFSLLDILYLRTNTSSAVLLQVG